VLYENKVTKWICRFYFNDKSGKKYILLNDDTGFNIDCLEDIYNHKQELNAALDRRK